MFARWELVEVKNYQNTPLGISFAGSDFDALEMSRQSREPRGLVGAVCVVAQSIGRVDLSVPDDSRPRKTFHLRRTVRGWEYDEWGLGWHGSLKGAATGILSPTRGHRAELRVFRRDGSLQCVALVDQWEESFHWTGMNHQAVGRLSV